MYLNTKNKVQLGSLKDNKILVASLQEWNYLLLSKHYLALEFAKRGNQVIFLSIERIFNKKFKRMYIQQEKFNEIIDKNISIFKIKVIAGFLKSKVLYLISKIIVQHQLRSLFEPDIILIFDPQFLMLSEFYKRAFKIYYCVDHIAPGHALKQAEQKILNNVDMLVAASDQLFTEYKGKHKNVFYIPHGVDLLNEYESAELKQKVTQWFKQFDGKVKIGYIGNVGPMVDLELINYLAKKIENSVLIIVGPVAPDVEKCIPSLESNVRFYGPVPAIGVKYCMSFLNAGIIPYKNNEFNNRRNPIKILQYLFFGMPVVTTRIGMRFDNPDLVGHADNKQEFKECLVKMIADDSKELAKLRKNYALSNSWSNRVEQLADLLDEFSVT